MSARWTMARIATDTFVARALPVGVRNRAYRMLIRELTHAARATTNGGEIFATPSMPCDRSSALKVVSLASSRDIEILLWSLKTLFFFTRFRWDLYVLDGGLNGTDVQLLEHHFPGIRVYREPNLTAELLGHLDEYALVREFRLNANYVPAKKIIDAPWLLQGSTFLLLDSDVLFFRYPSELIECLQQPDGRFAFSVDKLGINSGVAIVPNGRVTFSRIEAILQSMSTAQRRAWQIEQNLYAAVANDCFDELPRTYAIEPVRYPTYEDLVCCHFVHVLRHRFYEKGVAELRRNKFIDGLFERNGRRSRSEPITGGAISGDAV